MRGDDMLDVFVHTKNYTMRGGKIARPVLRDIAFSARPGEILALLGPSGIGKSTLLRICIGMDRDFQGTVKISPGTIGVMFQEPRLMPWLTVEQNLRLVKPELDVAALLQEVILPGIESLLPSALSLGMARRVALARALAVDPKMLALDEPFASLDRSLGSALGASIVDRAERRGVLVLMSTHEIDHALAMASRILVLTGDPATLSAVFIVPALGEIAALAQLRQEMLTRFAFLGT